MRDLTLLAGIHVIFLLETNVSFLTVLSQNEAKTSAFGGVPRKECTNKTRCQKYEYL